MGKTLLPYCQFLRVLDLRDLHELLDDTIFRGSIANDFFAGDLAYLIEQEETATPKKGPTTWPPRGNAKRTLLTRIILDVADSISKNAIKLEVLTEPVSPDLQLLSAGLIVWSPRLRYLQFLQLAGGEALRDESLQDLLVKSCPLLSKLEIYHWRNDDQSDALLARFFHLLAPNTLTSFQNESACGIGPLTCAALSTHAQSLQSLHLAIGDKDVSGLALLKPCTNLVSLALTDLSPPHDLAQAGDHVLTDMIEWFSNCSKLRDLTLTQFPSAPRLLTPALESNTFKLDSLEISGSQRQGYLYSMTNSSNFHIALANQVSLRSLLLAADSDGSAMRDSNTLCDSLTQLSNLRKLNLSGASDLFQDQHIVSLCDTLSELEELTIDANLVTDSTLHHLHKLSHLVSVTFTGFSTFSFQELSSFCDRLGPGNTGLQLDAQNPVWDGSLTEREQASVRRALKKRVDGSLLYQVRDPADAYRGESDSDSD